MASRARKLALLVAALYLCPAFASQWETDWAAAFVRARAGGKLVLADFRADWCKPCLAMERDVFPADEVQKRLADFVLLRVEYDRVEHRRYGITGIPAFVFFGADERPYFTIRGFQRPERFAANLDSIRVISRDAVEGIRLTSESGREAEGHLILGRVYMRTEQFEIAANEFRQAERFASRGGDPEIAQFARIDRAYVEGVRDSKKVLASLSKPLAGETARVEAYRHLVAGRIQKATKNAGAAAEEFRKAVNAAPAGDPIRREAELALATIESNRRMQ